MMDVAALRRHGGFRCGRSENVVMDGFVELWSCLLVPVIMFRKVGEDLEIEDGELIPGKAL